MGPSSPGKIRTKLEDFFVDEVVPPRIAQAGEHLHIRIEKRGISTEEAVRRLTRGLGISPKVVGRCGRKDVRAVTRQWLSVTGVSETSVDELALQDVTVIEHVRLPRKLRMGRFLGNRFRIRIRELGDGALAKYARRLNELTRRGLRNAIGEQRFGVAGVNARIGSLLIATKLEAALELLVETDEGRDIQRIRQRLHKGRTQDALQLLGRRRAGFYVSAHQSRIFNEVLDARAEAFDQALDGDLLHHHKSGRLLALEAPEAQERVASFEFSPTGPLPGPNMPEVHGAAHQLEHPFIGEQTMSDQRQWFGCLGTRRPLRVPVLEAEAEEGFDELGSYLELHFRLPPGAFGTQVLVELAGG